MRNNIVNIIKKTILNYDEYYIQEFDIQIDICNKIKKEIKNAKVFLEYPIISNKTILGFIDIMIEFENDYYPIELKYKTKYKNIETFYLGKTIKFNLKNQFAYNNNCYGFWKDIHRMENLSINHPNVKKGIGVFLTNDFHYLKGPEDLISYSNFSLKQGRIIDKGTILKWRGVNNPQKPNLKIKNRYILK
jgi:hypothetical protein